MLKKEQHTTAAVLAKASAQRPTGGSQFNSAHPDVYPSIVEAQTLSFIFTMRIFCWVSKLVQVETKCAGMTTSLADSSLIVPVPWKCDSMSLQVPTTKGRSCVMHAAVAWLPDGTWCWSHSRYSDRPRDCSGMFAPCTKFSLMFCKQILINSFLFVVFF